MAIEIIKSLNIRPRPDQYIMDEPLKKAVEMALAFNQPLLVTGAPGTGKTMLAFKVAAELAKQTAGQTTRFQGDPLRFNTKTTSQAKDLFYTYDAISHFQQANVKQEGVAARPTRDFIELQALGKAIAQANPKDSYSSVCKFDKKAASSSIVLVDEVDKAPRDFTNDLLNEIERYEFFIKEQDNFQIDLGVDNPQRILIIMTSNSEKNLPEAFLRRCVFYHIPLPDASRLKEILKAHLNQNGSMTEEYSTNLEAIAEQFIQIQEEAPRKAPATAELVAFVKMLDLDGLLGQKLTKNDLKKHFKENLSLLVKTTEDMQAIKELLS